MGTSLSVVPGLDEYLGGANVDLGLAGQHQRINAALAVSLAAAWEARRAQVGPSQPGWHVLTATLGDPNPVMLSSWRSSSMNTGQIGVLAVHSAEWWLSWHIVDRWHEASGISRMPHVRRLPDGRCAAAARRRRRLPCQPRSAAPRADGGGAEAAAGLQRWPALLLLARQSTGRPQRPSSLQSTPTKASDPMRSSASRIAQSSRPCPSPPARTCARDFC